ncbi:MAG: hypothetical protein MI749_15310 [Desulfovibrionales bacterium]|nr:hypothetical protein [Desulfovibrionales bacterium]
MKNLRSLRFLVLIFMIYSLSGCIRQPSFRYSQYYDAGQYDEAAESLGLTAEQMRTPDSGVLLGYLNAGVALRYSGAKKRSSAIFDMVETITKANDEQFLLGKAGASLGAVLLNDTILDYRPTQCESVMVNTYKALNFWQEGRIDLARVEFNRALDRQRRAKELFAREIAELQDEMASNKDSDGIQKTVENPEINKILANKYSTLHAFEPYPDFINPFTTYLAGLFFMSQGDRGKALPLLKEAYGMMEENPVVEKDFAILDGEMAGDDSHLTWVIFENGLGPDKEEMRIDLPLFLATDEVFYSGIALPRLHLRELAHSHLVLMDGQSRVLDETISLASMDRVIQTEFKKRYPLILTRALASALVKTTMQYAAKKNMGDLAGLLVSAIQATTTSADLRIWSGLPKEFQIARIPTPLDGKLAIETPEGAHLDILLPAGHDNLIYVKSPRSDASLYYDIIPMR